MDVLKSVIDLIFQAFYLATTQFLSSILIFYLVMSSILILIKIVRGTKKWR